MLICVYYIFWKIDMDFAQGEEEAKINKLWKYSAIKLKVL